MMIPNKIKTLLGFARKSGQLVSGESAVSASLKRKAPALILLALDMPEKRKTIFMHWCNDQEIRYLIMGTKEEYGNILGLSPRGVVAILDKQLAKAIKDQIP